MDCYACGTRLEPEHEPHDGSEVEYQFDNALWVRLDGGYGMFIDPMTETYDLMPTRNIEIAEGVWRDCIVSSTEWTEEEMAAYREAEWHVNRVVICHDCAHQACRLLPWMARLIDPVHSHSHKTAWKEAHPDHVGWDYRNCCAEHDGRDPSTWGP